jgi:hypothetical protein
MNNSQWRRIGAAAGIAYPIMQLIAQGLIQVGGAEPPFSAAAPEILEFFQNRDAALFAVGGYLSTLSLVVFLWFLGVLWSELRAAEGENGLLSMVALGSGVVTISTYLSAGGWPIAMFRIGEGLDPQIVQILFDQGNFSFANSWISIGSMVLAAGILFHQSERFPKWLGWSSVVLAFGLFFARFVWTSQIAFAPYVLFWVWMIALGILFLRRS